MRHELGFTLVELMVVVIIIGIIAAIALPSYTEHMLKKDRQLAQQEMQNIAMRAENHKMKNFSYKGFSIANDAGTDKYGIVMAVAGNGATWQMTAIRKDVAAQARNYDMLMTSTGLRCMTKVSGKVTSAATNCGDTGVETW